MKQKLQLPESSHSRSAGTTKLGGCEVVVVAILTGAMLSFRRLNLWDLEGGSTTSNFQKTVALGSLAAVNVDLGLGCRHEI